MLSNDTTQNVHLATEIEAEYLNRKLNFMWLAKYCSALVCIQEASITHCSSVWKRSLCPRAFSPTHQEIYLKMAQGKEQSFASRIFQKCRKSNQEQRGQENDVPHISEFSIMWDKLSKCSVAFTLEKCPPPFIDLSRMRLGLYSSAGKLIYLKLRE